MANDKGFTPEQLEQIGQLIALSAGKAVGETMLQLKKQELEAAEKAAKESTEAGRDAAILAERYRSKCPKCDQPHMACGYKVTKNPDGTETDNDKQVHEYIVVFPSQVAAMKAFQGVIINNVKYDSGNRSNRICVPRAAQVGAMVNTFELNEIEATQGRLGGAFRHMNPDGTAKAGVSMGPGGVQNVGNNNNLFGGFR